MAVAAGDVVTIKVDGGDLNTKIVDGISNTNYIDLSEVAVAPASLLTTIQNNKNNTEGMLIDKIATAGIYSQVFTLKGKVPTNRLVLYSDEVTKSEIRSATKNIYVYVNDTLVQTIPYTMDYTISPIQKVEVLPSGYYTQVKIASTDDMTFSLPSFGARNNTTSLAYTDLIALNASSAVFSVSMPDGFVLNTAKTAAINVGKGISIVQDTVTGDIVVAYEGIQDGSNNSVAEYSVKVIGAFTKYIAGTEQSITADRPNVLTVVTQDGKTLLGTSPENNRFQYLADSKGGSEPSFTNQATDPDYFDPFSTQKTIDLARINSSTDTFIFDYFVKTIRNGRTTKDVTVSTEIPDFLNTQSITINTKIFEISNLFDANNTEAFDYTITYTDGTASSGKLLKNTNNVINLDKTKTVKNISYVINTIPAQPQDYRMATDAGTNGQRLKDNGNAWGNFYALPEPSFIFEVNEKATVGM
jgi:hypothetical protein